MELHKKTMLEVQSLLNETGHKLELNDIADILELNEIAHQVTGTNGAYGDIYAWPVKCANLLLRPLTLGKIAWYNKRGLQWFEEDTECLTTVLAFLMSIENDEAFVWSLSSPEQAKEAIDAWEAQTEANPIQIAHAVDKILSYSKNASGSGDSDDQDYGPLIALLCREFGNTPKHWMYEVSIPVIKGLMDDYTRRINEEIKAQSRGTKGRKNAKAMKPIATPSMEATLKFRKKLLALKQRWEAAYGN